MDQQHKLSLGVIGGSGLYTMPGLTGMSEYAVETPFGKPSAPIILGNLEGARIAFLARHGLGHHLAPSEVNYRANIYALKMLGVERILSINACGSLREDYTPGQIIIPDQIFDFTRGREKTFFCGGMVAHIGCADPFCPDLSARITEAVSAGGGMVHRGGTFVIIDGPRFSTRAESNAYRAWGMSLVGMTAAPEAFLAREAEMCYSIMAHVTDYDVWHVDEAPVTVEMVVQVLNHNTTIAREAIRSLVKNLPEERFCSCGSALENAIITDPAVIPPKVRENINLLIRKYIH